MEAISKDLRERVAAAHDRGEGKSPELAERFGVSASWVRRLLQRRRETGSLAPKKYKLGPKRKLSDTQRDRLCELVAKNPDLTLEQQRDDVQAERRAWSRKLRRIEPKRLIFLNENGARTHMKRLYGRSAKGLRVLDDKPVGRLGVASAMVTPAAINSVTWS